MLFFTGIGIILSFVPGLIPGGFGIGFTYAFFIGGLVWLAVAYLSGGFVSTYAAPLPVVGRGGALYYANPDRTSNLPLTGDRPEVMEDLRNKMADQPTAMGIAFLKGLAFFGLAALFYEDSRFGAVALVALIIVFLTVATWSRPGRS